jgi:hypothetical protein
MHQPLPIWECGVSAAVLTISKRDLQKRSGVECRATQAAQRRSGWTAVDERGGVTGVIGAKNEGQGWRSGRCRLDGGVASTHRRSHEAVVVGISPEGVTHATKQWRGQRVHFLDLLAPLEGCQGREALELNENDVVGCGNDYEITGGRHCHVVGLC